MLLFVLDCSSYISYSSLNSYLNIFHFLTRLFKAVMVLRLLQSVLIYQWLEDSLRLGEKVSEDLYSLKVDPEGGNRPDKSSVPKKADGNNSGYEEPLNSKKIKPSPEDSEKTNAEESKEDTKINALYDEPSTPGGSDESPHSIIPENTCPNSPDALNKDVRFSSQ
jgi:DNA polymerase lambda